MTEPTGLFVIEKRPRRGKQWERTTQTAKRAFELIGKANDLWNQLKGEYHLRIVRENGNRAVRSWRAAPRSNLHPKEATGE